MKPYILVCDGMDSNVFAELLKVETLETFPEAKNSQDKIKELLAKAHALVIRSATKVTAETLELAPNLKYVIRAGEGTDNIDKKACEAKGVKVSNTPGANNNSAAEHALALMMTVLRRTAHANQRMQEGGWDKSHFTGVELWKKKVGIVGFGRIGQILAKRLAGFEPEVLFYDPFLESSDIPYAKKVADLKEIFSSCDVISLHTPLVPATESMVNTELLNLMPEHSILVNASRGKIVDEEALLKVLTDKKIRGAGFDVFAEEPLPEGSPLRGLENLILTPHLGASTEEAQIRVGEMCLHQLKEFFINNNHLNEVKS